MGHDITLKLSNIGFAWTRISFNWSESQYKKYFHISDIHGHSGKNGVIRKLKEALKELAKDNYHPNTETIIDCWGHPPNGVTLTEEQLSFQKYCMFASHLSRFLQLAEQNPKAYWYSDQCFAYKKLYQYDFKDTEVEEAKFREQEASIDTSVANVILKSQQAGEYATIDTDSDEVRC